MNFFIHRIFHASFAILAVSSITEITLADGEGTPEPNLISIRLSGDDIVGPFITEALRNNPGLQAYEKRYQAARESILSARALPNPKIQLTHFIEAIQTRTGPQRDVLVLQQPIPWLGKLRGSGNIARAHSESLWHAYSAHQFTIIETIANRVLEIAFLDKSIVLTRENTVLLRQLEILAEERFKSGGNLTDLLRLQVETERFDDQIARQQAERIGLAAKLEALLGRRISGTISEINWQSPQSLKGNSDQWLTATRNNNPKLKILRSLEQSQEARERLASLSNKPDFTVGLNYHRTGDAINPNTADSGKDPWAIMVGLSLPIWGKSNHSISLQASLQKEAISAQIEEQELHLLGEVRAWIAKLDDSQKRLDRYNERLLPLARQAKEITESSYRANQVSLLDVIDSERTLIELETKYWQAAADAWVARWNLATISGGTWLD